MFWCLERNVSIFSVVERRKWYEGLCSYFFLDSEEPWTSEKIISAESRNHAEDAPVPLLSYTSSVEDLNLIVYRSLRLSRERSVYLDLKVNPTWQTTWEKYQVKININSLSAGRLEFWLHLLDLFHLRYTL